ncbi:MAG: hypothetical protein II767_02435 [Proteobacteria bacterium]|nr:hypothetical protein [Pseudomonadota bacterium]
MIRKIAVAILLCGLMTACSDERGIMLIQDTSSNPTQPQDPQPQDPQPQDPQPQDPQPQDPQPCAACTVETACMDGNSYRTCADKNGDGCPEPTIILCPDDYVCQNGACVPGVPTCADTCESDTPECVTQTTLRTCKDLDGDGCREWVASDCTGTDICQNGACGQFIPQCTDTCDPGAQCLDEHTLRTCKDHDGDGCREWVPDMCPNGQVCQNGACVTPAPQCSNACTAGQKQCNGNDVQTCADYNGDGCTEWGGNSHCDYKCENAACVAAPPQCTNACTNGQKRCSNNAVQTCADYNGDGCTEWGGDSKCSYKCEGSKCVDDPLGWVPPCTTSICPKPITDFSKRIEGNTKNSKNVFNDYPTCHTFNTTSVPNESGPEDYYVVNITEPGTLIVGLKSTGGSDVDVHLLTSLKSNACIARADESIGQHVDKGIYYIVADTFKGSSNAGAYWMKVTFIADSSKCGMQTETMPRYGSCSTIQLPVTAGTAQEAHLVTDHDRQMYGNSWWPSSKTNKVAEHKAYTDQLFGAGTSAGGEWCPAEGGNIGQGSAGNYVPADAEAWYINMYWKKKPDKGTRFLAVDPLSGKTVVAAAGYETGPGACSHMGGAVYEIHHYFGTSHNSPLTFGRMKNQSLKYGPIDCTK